MRTMDEKVWERKEHHVYTNPAYLAHSGNLFVSMMAVVRS